MTFVLLKPVIHSFLCNGFRKWQTNGKVMDPVNLNTWMERTMITVRSWLNTETFIGEFHVAAENKLLYT
jgi:hypothetical protein